MYATTHQAKILRALKEAGRNGVENYRLSKISLRYGSVIASLRADGHTIITERDYLQNGRATNTYRYRLTRKKNPPVPRHADKSNKVVKELMIAKSKGRYACYRYISKRLAELGA